MHCRIYMLRMGQKQRFGNCSQNCVGTGKVFTQV